MFIPLQHNQAEAISPTDVGTSRQAHRTRRISGERRVYWLGDYGAVLFRVVLLLIGGIELALSGMVLSAAPAPGVAVVIAGCVLVAGITSALPPWALLIADGAAVSALILATGGAASPMLILAPALVVHGSLFAEERDALASAGIGVIILLLIATIDPAHESETLTKIAAMHVLVSVAAVWGAHRARRTLSRLQEDMMLRTRVDRDCDEVRRVLEWQRQNVAMLGACSSTADLARCAIDRATAITGASASIESEQAPAPPFRHTLAIAGIGRLVIDRAPVELSRLQRDALEHLAATAAQRAFAVRSIAVLERHRRALMALWEGAGVLRATPSIYAILPDVCRRIAAALDLDWMALIGPDERQTLAPFLVVRGRDSCPPPRLYPTHFHLAAEVLRGGRSLVRLEQGQSLVFLPVRVAGEPSLVLAARGAVDDAALQALLLLLGDLIAERLMGCTPSAEPDRQ